MIQLFVIICQKLDCTLYILVNFFAFFASSQMEPLRVVVTGAAGQIAYSLLYSIGKGDVFGPNQVKSSVISPQNFGRTQDFLQGSVWKKLLLKLPGEKEF